MKGDMISLQEIQDEFCCGRSDLLWIFWSSSTDQAWLRNFDPSAVELKSKSYPRDEVVAWFAERRLAKAAQ